MRRRGLAALAVACALGAGACGGGGDDGGEGSTTDATTAAAPTPAEDSAAAKAAVDAYVAAFLALDGEGACALLTEESRQEFVEQVEDLVGTSDCGEAFAAAARQIPEEDREGFATAPIEITGVAGDRAEGTAVYRGNAIAVRLVREDGEWRVANLPGQ